MSGSRPFSLARWFHRRGWSDLIIGLPYVWLLLLFLLPFLLALTLTERARFLPPSRETVVKTLRLGLAFAVPFAVYLLYNWARFGNPLETGHTILAAEAPTSVEDTIVTHRLIDIGVTERGEDASRGRVFAEPVFWVPLNGEREGASV